jgi:hypothetical protein
VGGNGHGLIGVTFLTSAWKFVMEFEWLPPELLFEQTSQRSFIEN